MQHNLISQQNIKVKDTNINATQFLFHNLTSRSRVATSMQHNLISQQNIKVKDNNIGATQFNFTTNHQGQR